MRSSLGSRQGRSDGKVYHGMRDQRATFPQVLADLVSFLTSHPTETVVMSVKDEVRNEDFSRLVWLDMAKYHDMWFLENRVPALGEVRGKAILLTRFWASKSCAAVFLRVSSRSLGSHG